MGTIQWINIIYAHLTCAKDAVAERPGKVLCSGDSDGDAGEIGVEGDSVSHHLVLQILTHGQIRNHRDLGGEEKDKGNVYAYGYSRIQAQRPYYWLHPGSGTHYCTVSSTQ